MDAETMSVTRALKELKLLDKRITDGTNVLKICDVTQQKFGNKALGTQITGQEFSLKAKSSFQSLQDLINRRGNIKSAIVLSNANTAVKIGSKTMTVAKAIEEKRFLPVKAHLLQKLMVEIGSVRKLMEQNKAQLDNQITNLVQQNTGKDRKIDKDDYEKIAKPFIEANELHLLDPINVDAEIERLRNEINEFETDVDVSLTETNSRTMISI